MLTACPAGEGPGPVFIGSEIYRRSGYGPWHPLRIPRVSTVTDLVRVLGWLSPSRFRAAPCARPAALHAWHSPAYVAALERAEAEQAVDAQTRVRHGLGTVSNPVFPGMFRRPATGVGGVMLAAALLRGGGVVHVPGGGTHHGLPDRASGFCYLNDPVFAVLALRAGGAARVAYVDLDAHHPDGVELAFAGDPAVLVLSVHEEGRWPGTGALEDCGAGEVWNLPVPRGLHDDDMARILDALVLPAVERFQPDAVVLQCGADGLLEDPQSRLALSNNAHVRALRALRPLSPRLMVLGGGGYNPWSVGRAWARLWGEILGQHAPGRLPPEAEAVLRGLRWARPGGGRFVTPQEAWVTTLEDPWRGGAATEGVAERLAVLRARLSTWI
ncbi:acetoin utilization protein [Rubellimicrobium thermophilum]|uniref:acetoin utilization protein n=1 Tax=Rubellimicrobium thermophilum TaxID=295419 RepID=UPI00068691A6|nr:acetoin utilization protein [Rubellimicrobium thermophilum]